MLPPPRIVAIDDDRKHLQGLADALNLFGAGCLPIHFTEMDKVTRCPYVRVIFADLHLTEGGAATDHARHMGVIGGLIEESIVPSGPYMVVLWTRFPDQANDLHRFLNERLKIAKPFAVRALDKSVHLNLPEGTVKDSKALVEAIIEAVKGEPQITALLGWEEHVLGAAAETMAAILGLATSKVEPAERNQTLGVILWRLAVEAVGEDHVDKDRFKAVNEALLPILADRIAFLRSSPERDDNPWKSALIAPSPGGDITLDEASRLNELLHIADGAGTVGDERGAVIPLPAQFAGDGFRHTFGLDVADAAADFGCKGFVPGDNRFIWLLVQVQAACDFAQQQVGPLPFLLGLEMPTTSSVSKGTPAAVWIAPFFHRAGQARALHVNFRFPASLTAAEATKITPVYRLREQLLNDLAFRSHFYGARPGIVRIAAPKTAPPAKAAGPQDPGGAVTPKAQG